MLAGCSSTLLSPRHRLRSEAAAAACHLQLPSSMSTQRLDLPCSFPSRSQSSASIRPQLTLPVGDKGIESGRLSVRLPSSPAAANQWEIKKEHHHHKFWDEEEEKGKSRKRRLSDEDDDQSNVKRKKFSSGLGFLGHLVGSTDNLWFHDQQPHQFSITCSGGGDVDTNQGSSRSSSFSSEANQIPPSITATLDHDHENGSTQLYYPPTVVGAPHNGENRDPQEEERRRGFELVTLLTSCVESISARNIGAVSHYIGRLGEMASPRGGSPLTRLVAYYTEALALRVTRIWPHLFHITLPRTDDENGGSALRVLNQVSPIPKFIHFTANEMLLRAFEGKDRIHVIDFDIKQGLQWGAFFQSLSTRGRPPRHVRITGIGKSKQDLIETGEQLHGFAETFNVEFEFHPVVDRLEDVRLWMLHVKEGESVGVNCIFQLHKLLYDPSGGAFRDFTGLIRSTNPAAVVMAEQEAEHNEVSLERRVCNSLEYYSAVFDMIDSSLGLESTARGRMEEMFGREIRNVVGCEGRERFERHEGFGKWIGRMVEEAGFRCLGVSDREMMQTRILLRMYDCDGYNVEKTTIRDGCEGVTLRWFDKSLCTVSGWVPESQVVEPSCSSS